MIKAKSNYERIQKYRFLSKCEKRRNNEICESVDLSNQHEDKTLLPSCEETAINCKYV